MLLLFHLYIHSFCSLLSDSVILPANVALARRIEASEETLDPRQIGSALYGLKGMKNSLVSVQVMIMIKIIIIY